MTREGLWAVPVTSDVVRLHNTPWFVRGVANGDLVRVRRDDDGGWRAVERLQWSGYRTIRVVPFRSGSLEGSFVSSFTAALGRRVAHDDGCDDPSAGPPAAAGRVADGRVGSGLGVPGREPGSGPVGTRARCAQATGSTGRVPVVSPAGDARRGSRFWDGSRGRSWRWCCRSGCGRPQSATTTAISILKPRAFWNSGQPPAAS